MVCDRQGGRGGQEPLGHVPSGPAGWGDMPGLRTPGYHTQLFPGTAWDPEPSDAVPKPQGLMIQALDGVLQRPTRLQAPRHWAEVPSQGWEHLSSYPSMEAPESRGLPSRA